MQVGTTGARRGNNEGSVYKRKDGRWVGAATVGGGPGGQKKKIVYGKTRQEAAAKLTDVLKAVKDDMPLAPELLTISKFAEQWLGTVRSSIAPKTYESYESNLRVHVEPRFGNVRLSKLTPGHISALYADMSIKGKRPRTVRACHAVLHTMLEKAVRLGLVIRNVAKLVDLPKQDHRDMPMITPEQAKDFLQKVSGHRLEALFVLAITTGARQGELLGLTWDRVDLDAGEMDIRHALQYTAKGDSGGFRLGDTKRPSSRRRVALTAIAVGALRRHRVRQAEQALRLGPAWTNEWNLVFTTTVGTPLSRTRVTRLEFRPLLSESGLPTELTFHDLRHIAASLALGEGLPVTLVSEMLGHADAATTLRVYAHAVPGAQRQVAAAMDALLSG
jgi:integrase